MSEKSKVILIPCDTYEKFVGKDEKILLKPNLLKKAELERAVITHPAVVGGFARLLRENGYKNIILADSCGHGTTKRVIQGTGLDTCLEELNIPAIDYTEGVEVKYPEGVQAKEFIMPKELVESDCVISLSKMKTHALERITGAVKNSYGFIYGLHKAKGHTLYPSADSFARMLIDLNACVKPRLFIMDGVVAMEGNGPGSGEPVSMNVLLFSEDAVALDSVFARLVYLKPELVPTNYHGEKMGYGVWQEDRIEVITPDGIQDMNSVVQQFGNPKFDVDRREIRTGGKWNKIARAFNLFQKKPYIEKDKCIKCGICVKSCPVPEKAVDFKKGRHQPPVYDYKKCIRCFCCQEMCPEKAIKVK